MIKKILTVAAIVTLVTSCGGVNKTENTKEATNTPEQKTEMPVQLIKDVDNYFATFKPKDVEVLVLGKQEFETKFNGAATMQAKPTEVDFTAHKVGAIVMPETNFETDILINKTSIEGRKLIIDYSTQTKGEKRSFTIVPIKLFQYGIMLDIDSVSFVKDGVKTNLLK